MVFNLMRNYPTNLALVLTSRIVLQVAKSIASIPMPELGSCKAGTVSSIAVLRLESTFMGPILKAAG